MKDLTLLWCSQNTDLNVGALFYSLPKWRENFIPCQELCKYWFKDVIMTMELEYWSTHCQCKNQFRKQVKHKIATSFFSIKRDNTAVYKSDEQEFN